MPSYDYKCEAGHYMSAFRKISSRHDAPACKDCGANTVLIMSAPHVGPDGIYSYCPNVGTEWDFERKRSAVREGRKVQQVTRRPDE